MPYPNMPQVCDYTAVRKEFANLFRRSRQCIISVDIDGILSAVLASHLFEWEVVGFYTLTDLWVSPKSLPKDERNPEAALRKAGVAFLDHDIYRSEIDSIGHHLLQWSPDTPIPLHTEGRSSLNPNLLRGITKREFGRKYPFGTFHFLLACASAWDLLRGFEPDDEMTALLLHIDSSFVNAINYQDNALDWLDWLGGSEARSPLYPICKRMLKWSPRRVIERFKALAERFGSLGIRPRSQAQITDPTRAEEWQGAWKLIEWVEKDTGWNARFADFRAEALVHFAMDRRSCKPNRSLFEPIIAKEPFSYAIIGSGELGLNYNWFAGRAPRA